MTYLKRIKNLPACQLRAVKLQAGTKLRMINEKVRSATILHHSSFNVQCFTFNVLQKHCSGFESKTASFLQVNSRQVLDTA